MLTLNEQEKASCVRIDTIKDALGNTVDVVCWKHLMPVTCNPPESIYCMREDCETCRPWRGQYVTPKDMRYKCDQCGKYRPAIDYFVRHVDNDEPIRICSPSCLVELAWAEKEQQAKLSKSKG